MDQIRQQVARARRRLWIELFLSRLVRCWFVTLLIAVAAIAVPKVVPIDRLPESWSIGWLVGSLAVGGLGALVWTWCRGRSELDAAIEIDRRFGLRERVASSLSLPTDAIDSPAGQALLADAQRAVSRLEIEERFRIRVGRIAWLPLGPALVALVLVALVDNRQALSSAEPQQELTRQQRDNATAALRKRLLDRKKEAAKKGLKEAEALLAQVEKNIEKIAQKRELDRKQTLVKLNDVAKQLDERRQQMGGNRELRRQLAGMKDFNKGPAEKLLDAMKKGEWNKAQQELQKLQDQLTSGKLDDEAKAQLQKQVEQLKNKLEQAAADQKRAIEHMQKQIDRLKREGKLAEAGDMQQKLDQMKAQQRAAEQMAQMAKQLQQCQECMQNGDAQGAAQAMKQMMEQMEQLERNMAEGEMLDMARQQLEMAKDAMACKECEGQGCQACQGGNKFGNKPGMNMGQGIGAGPRPEERTDVNFRNTNVKQNTGPGAAVITGEAEGPNFRGNVLEQIKEEMESQGSQPADPLVVEQLPKTHRENAEDYFNRLRDGE